MSPDRFTLGGHLMMPTPNDTVRLCRGRITVVNSKLDTFEPTDEIGLCDFGGEGAVICPGFVDAHLHLPQFDSIGVFGLELLDWLDRVIFPAEARWADADYAAQMGDRVAGELLRFGTTGVAAYGTVHHEGTKAAIRALADRGLAGCVGQVLMDRNAPDELVRPADQLIAEAARFERFGRIEPAVTPRFAVSCSDQLLHAAGELACAQGWAVQTHLAETEAECALIAELFDGTPYTEVYRRAGLLGERSILGHGIHLPNAERRTLEHTGSVIAHCPTANLFLRAGEMDRAGLTGTGVRLALGTDVAGGPDRSMPRVARAMLETAIRRGDEPPTAAQAWWMITTGNANAIGRPELSRLEPGADADLLVIRPTIRWADAPDPLATLLWGWDDRWLERTIVGGR